MSQEQGIVAPRRKKTLRARQQPRRPAGAPAESPSPPDPRPAAAPPDRSGDQPWYRRVLVRETARPQARAELDMTPWSRRGLLTVVLITAVFQLPFAVLNHAGHAFGETLSFASDLVLTYGPAPIPVTLGLGVLLAAPLARALAREPRGLRLLESLGLAATIEIGLIIAWQAAPHSLKSYHDGKVVAGSALASLLGYVFGIVVYPVLNRYISRRARPRPPR